MNWLNSIPVLSLLSVDSPARTPQVSSGLPISRRHSLKTSLKHPSDNAAAFSWTEIILDLIVLALPNHCISCHDHVYLAPNNRILMYQSFGKWPCLLSNNTWIFVTLGECLTWPIRYLCKWLNFLPLETKMPQYIKVVCNHIQSVTNLFLAAHS